MITLVKYTCAHICMFDLLKGKTVGSLFLLTFWRPYK